MEQSATAPTTTTTDRDWLDINIPTAPQNSLIADTFWPTSSAMGARMHCGPDAPYQAHHPSDETEDNVPDSGPDAQPEQPPQLDDGSHEYA